MATSHTPREAIAAALFALVNSATGKVLNLRTSSRTLRHFDDVDHAHMPALFQTQKPETAERSVEGLPAKRTMHFELWLYVSEPQMASIVPSAQLNLMVDAVEVALAPSPVTGVQTLGNVCSHAWVEGAIEYYEGLTHDGKSVAVVPVAVLLP